MVFDPLVSRYETRVLDRGDVAEGSLQSRHNRNIDKISFALPDLLLADTEAHGRFYIESFSVPENRVRTLQVGFDEDIFHYRPQREFDGVLKVLFYGTYLPLHGIETIIGAAELLRDSCIRFTLVGGGQTFCGARRMAEHLPPGKIEFLPPVGQEELGGFISNSDVVLGIFGLTRKAYMVVPNKLYQSLAVGRAVVTADTPAVRELFRDGEHLLTVPPGNPAALARSLKTLLSSDELRRRLAESGGALVRGRFNSTAIAGRLEKILREERLL